MCENFSLRHRGKLALVIHHLVAAGQSDPKTIADVDVAKLKGKLGHLRAADYGRPRRQYPDTNLP